MKSIPRHVVENMVFYLYTNEQGDKVLVSITGSDYMFPIELHNCKKEICSFKELFGEIK